MTCAEHGRVIDVDSHLFELGDFHINSARDGRRAMTRKETQELLTAIH